MSSVACYFPGCSAPVIGQCSGYSESCGHFYCAHHSNGKLCEECHLEMERESESQRIYEDYVRAVKEVDRKAIETNGRFVLRFVFWVVLLAVVGSVVLYALGIVDQLTVDARRFYEIRLEAVVGTVAFFSAIGGYFVSLIVSSLIGASQRQRWITEMDAKKAYFAEFYEEYKKEKRRQYMRTALMITAGVVAGGLAESADNARIRRAVDDELKRRA